MWPLNVIVPHCGRKRRPYLILNEVARALRKSPIPSLADGTRLLCVLSMLHTGAALLRLGSGINRCFILSAIWDPYATFVFCFFLPSEVGCFVLQHSGWISCLSRPSPSFPSFFNVYRAVISWFMEQMDNLRFTHLVEKAGSLLVIFI